MLKEAGGIRRVVLKTGCTDLRRGIDGLKAVISLNGMDPWKKGHCSSSAAAGMTGSVVSPTSEKAFL